MHEQELNVVGYDLKYLLHRQKYLQLIQQGQTLEAYKYTKEHLSAYMNKKGGVGGVNGKPTAMIPLINYREEVNKLMGMLAYIKDIANSPYKSNFTDSVWEILIDNVISAFCAICGLPKTPPLECVVNSGAISLPLISKYLQLAHLKTKKGTSDEEGNTKSGEDRPTNEQGFGSQWKSLSEDPHTSWYDQKELPTETPLPDSMLFHSVFACPVSRDQSTTQNPPMMMPCGHTICKESLEKLAKNFKTNRAIPGRVKCPYCPELFLISQAKNVYF